MDRVVVRDAGNERRVLGCLTTVPHMHDRMGSERLRFSVIRPGPRPPPTDPLANSYTHIDFYLRFAPEAGGWMKRGYLVTDAPLSDLCLMRDFEPEGRHPDEDYWDYYKRYDARNYEGGPAKVKAGHPYGTAEAPKAPADSAAWTGRKGGWRWPFSWAP
jgi:hypothetical protein